MFIEKLTIKNFKNIKNETLSPCKNFNLLYGNNAQGKTNILECIYLISNFSSYKTFKNSEFINENEKQCKIKANLNDSISKNVIEYNINNNAKVITINNKKIKKPEEVINNLKTIIISPEENYLLRGSPEIRRSLIDRSIFIKEPEYIQKINNYKKCVKHRNKILKSKKYDNQIESWNNILIKEGSFIRFKRFEYISSIMPLVNEIHSEICSGDEYLEIQYKKGDYSLKEIEKKFEEEVNNNKEKEVLYKQTLSGPHRDDPIFILNDKNTKFYSSQGQQKTFLISLKLAQLIDLGKIKSNLPILLLDDISSEIDKKRKNIFFDILRRLNCQTFITTTDINNLSNDIQRDSYKINVKNGMLYT